VASEFEALQPNPKRFLSGQSGNNRALAQRAGAIDNAGQAVRHHVQEPRDASQEEDGRERELDRVGDVGDVFG
jgi:hypothetical protein